MRTWIPLLVPQEDFEEFAALVSAREAERGLGPGGVDIAELPAPGSVASADPDGARLVPWDLADLRKLASSGGEFVTVQRWALALDVLSAHENGWLSSAQVAAEAGLSIQQWRDAARKLTRHLAKHYGPNVGWPALARGGRELRLDDQVYWKVTPAQADRWRTVRAEGGVH